MKKTSKQYIPSNRKELGFTDYFKIINSFFIVIIGIIIFYRAFIFNMHIVMFLIGFCFFAFGLYRLKFVIAYFKEREIF